MTVRAKYKVEDRVEFTFAGSLFTGTIMEVRKDMNKVSYRVEDSRGTKYPVQQDKIVKKL